MPGFLIYLEFVNTLKSLSPALRFYFIFSYFCSSMPDIRLETACFQRFKTSIDGIAPPDRFTFPFYYSPHRIALIAAEELQKTLSEYNWDRNFGIGDSSVGAGKMFGVLVVKNSEGEIGYLKAYSGQLNNPPGGFVPFVYQLPETKNFFSRGCRVIENYTEKIQKLEHLPERAAAKKELQRIEVEAGKTIAALREKMRKAKAERKTQRREGEKQLSAQAFADLQAKLARESRQCRYVLKAEVAGWNERVESVQEKSDRYENEFARLVEERANFSADLQRQLFDRYEFLNRAGERKTVSEIFVGKAQAPAGTGDCAAPKLLQYAFENGLTPLSMAEFWWGASPNGTIRRHKKFYPACSSKCKPVLGHMLAGMAIDPNPMVLEHGQDKQIETVYEDDYILVVNKPFGLLSVPGKEIEDSVLSRMRIKYPEATGPLLVHRLDMDTSGLLLIAKSLKIHKLLQGQFLKRKVRKRYVAILAGKCEQKEGTVELPLRLDIEDRPNQMVCFEHGKNALTRFEVVEVKNGKTRIHFFPKTGRTHQLRVHAAHPLGLNCPIVGDILYGRESDRMYLHAEILEFEHPVSKKQMKVAVDGDF